MSFNKLFEKTTVKLVNIASVKLPSDVKDTLRAP